MWPNTRRAALGIAAAVIGLFLLLGREETRRVWIDAGATAPERPARWPSARALRGPSAEVPTTEAGYRWRPAASDLRDAPADDGAPGRLGAFFGASAGSLQGSAFLEIVSARRGEDGRVHYELTPALPMRSTGRASPRALHRAPVWSSGPGGAGAASRWDSPAPRATGTTPTVARVATAFPAVSPTSRLKEDATSSAEAVPSGWEGLEASGLPEAVGGWLRRFHERFSERRARPARPPRMSLRSLLGKGLLRPPTGRLVPPDFSKLGPPPVPPDRRRVDARPPSPSEVEALSPPEEDRSRSSGRRERRRKAHWHPGAGVEYYHSGSRWGLLRGERWVWMVRSGDRWWTLGDETPLVRHQGHWWWRTSDGWFLLHYGQPWAYRLFADLRKDGLLHPLTRVRIVYSEDARRAALVVPGGETLVYDVASGEIVARLPAEADRAGGLTPGPRP